MHEHANIIIPVDMSTLSVKTKHGSEPPLHLTPSMRRKVAAPMYTTDMTRAKTVNNIEEQQLNKKLRDLEKQQIKMQAEILNLKASLLPEIKVTSAWEDKSTDEKSIQPSQGTTDTNQLRSNPPASGSEGNQELPKNRKRSGSLPPLSFRKEAERERLTAAPESADTGTLFTPSPPLNTGGIRRSRSMNELDGRARPRPKSAHIGATDVHNSNRRRSICLPRSRSLNSSTESLPSDPPNTKRLSNADGSSAENVTRPRAQTISSLLPLRKAKSTTNINKKVRTRRVTVDMADLTRLDKDSIFKNPSYNPVLLNPSQSRATNSVPRHRRATSPVRLSHLSPDAMQPSPPAKSTPTLQDQFEQLKACRYLRVPSEDSD
ncbi:uncharacterized protein LOC119722548 [Patiria miniata]|uniref:Uncharacterized protein n=1 Tax=Patiria miniata TaxID=46514 RepID=A0A913ZAM0_PATMI|nr:uncharacterized protein LOC119722548 [Patiria miniata]